MFACLYTVSGENLRSLIKAHVSPTLPPETLTYCNQKWDLFFVVSGWVSKERFLHFMQSWKPQDTLCKTLKQARALLSSYKYNAHLTNVFTIKHPVEENENDDISSPRYFTVNKTLRKTPAYRAAYKKACKEWFQEGNPPSIQVVEDAWVYDIKK